MNGSCLILAFLALGDEASAEVLPELAITPLPETRPEWWDRAPRPQVFPPPGNFVTPPRHSGYHSVRDWFLGIERESLPKNPFSNLAPQPLPFFETNFHIVDPPGEDRSFPWLDRLKRVPCGDHWLFASGGEYRWRFANEGNARLTTIDNNYYLNRLRVFGDLWYEDRFRVYLEFISADIAHNDLPPVLPDRDPADFLNAFVEMKLGEIDNRAVALRAGRQELLFGSQRLIGTLDWANTRRTFDGVRSYWRGEDHDFDLFWAQPVIPSVTGIASPNENVNLAGAWWSIRPQKDVWADIYALYTGNASTTTTKGIPQAPIGIATLGSATPAGAMAGSGTRR